MKKSNYFYLVIGIASFLACAGIVQATQTFTEDIVVPSIRVGSQGVGGVTYFNGTIINKTTDSEGNGVAVTFGDDVRIDGTIFRTEGGGDNPIKVADSIRPATSNAYSLGTSDFLFQDGYFSGTLTTGTLVTTALSGSGIVTSDNITDGAVATADLADNAITSDKISNSTITGSDVSSSTDLSINGLTVAGDITLSSINGRVDGIIISTIPNAYVSQSSPTWWDKESYVSVSPVACSTGNSSIEYLKTNYAIYTDESSLVYCSVQLPHNALVTSFSVQLTDDLDTDDLLINLTRTKFVTVGNTSEAIASITSTGESGRVILSDTSIILPDVDNNQYTYAVVLLFPDGGSSDLAFEGAKITYNFTEPY